MFLFLNFWWHPPWVSIPRLHIFPLVCCGFLRFTSGGPLSPFWRPVVFSTFPTVLLVWKNNIIPNTTDTFLLRYHSIITTSSLSHTELDLSLRQCRRCGAVFVSYFWGQNSFEHFSILQKIIYLEGKNKDNPRVIKIDKNSLPVVSLHCMLACHAKTFSRIWKIAFECGCYFKNSSLILFYFRIRK